MNRSLYSLGIFFLGLILRLAVLHGVMLYMLGNRIFSLESFINWYALNCVIYLVASIIVLKYYHFKNYQLNFSIGILSAIVNFIYFVVVYNLLISRQLNNLYTIALLAALCIGLLYGMSLTFSKSKERPYLKTAGIFLMIFQMVLASSIYCKYERSGYVSEKYFRKSYAVDLLSRKPGTNIFSAEFYRGDEASGGSEF